MSNSYRIRTQVGVDKSIKVNLEQEFESLEILSLKILQSDIYARQCSDYGVIVGRITANNGYGIPNCKVSIFIPLTSEDEVNLVTTELYPYKTLSELNDDGIRYNLLPYTQQHGGHVPTGTFPTREDVLTNPQVQEVYDKYYKYSVQTNESGDYMIFGVPVGNQTLHVDIDLSDIGEFSLSPQDLIRTSNTTEGKVNGTQFKSSNNLSDLPQILTINRTVEVEPLWGQPEICNLGITRTDFDILEEFGIKIEPCAIFLGSIFSNSDEYVQKQNCKVNKNLGDKCALTTGPGEILAIRQTIYRDSNGRPILESHTLEQGGKCIDENGAWLINLPMNLDYIYTNEYGEKSISTDPKIGLPTKAKYRFKVKWSQPPNLSDSVRRAYFLIPNIKEWGWDAQEDPFSDGYTDPTYLENFFITNCNPPDSVSLDNGYYKAAKASYAFSLDWLDYGQRASNGNLTTIGLQMVEEAIKCEDRFYEMSYNKVYSVSQLMSEYAKGPANKRYIAIKEITSSECVGPVNTPPATDVQYRPSALYGLASYFLRIISIILFPIIVVFHIVKAILTLFLALVIFIQFIICELAGIEILGVSPFGFLNEPCDKLTEFRNQLEELLFDGFTLNLPLYLPGECEFCDCSISDSTGEDVSNAPGVSDALNNTNVSCLSKFYSPSTFENCLPYPSYVKFLFSGNQSQNNGSATAHAPTLQELDDNNVFFTSSLTIPERLNLFNTKAKYFDESGDNPGGGWNRIKVSFDVNQNDPNTQWHLDNVVALVINPVCDLDLSIGNLLSFQNLEQSNDPNLYEGPLNSYGNNSVTGTPIGTLISVGETEFYQTNVNLTWAKPDGSGNNSTIYTINQDSNDINYLKFPTDVEYFQIIHKSTVQNFIDNSDPNNPDSFANRFLNNYNVIIKLNDTQGETRTSYHSPCATDFLNQIVVFVVRGVDPNSSRVNCQIDLSRLYGFNTDFLTTWGNSSYVIQEDLKLNIPVQGSFKNVRHSPLLDNTTIDPYSGIHLFYDSFHFQPDTTLFQNYQTNYPYFYSKIDNNNTANSPIQASTSSSYGLKIVNTNGFCKELYYLAQSSPNIWITTPPPSSSPTPDLQYNYPNTQSPSTLGYGRNRGYYLNEIVEGSGLLYLNDNNSFYVDWLGTPILEFPSTPDFSNPLVPAYADIYYFSESYSTTSTMTFTLNNIGNERRMVMRSDRLPTSTIQENNGNYSYPLFINKNLYIKIVSDNGVSLPFSAEFQVTNFSGNSVDYNEDLSDISSSVSNFDGAINSFTCAGAVPSDCYQESSDGYIQVLPTDNPCNTIHPLGVPPALIVENGCYTLVRYPILSLLSDIKYLFEWSFRVRQGFIACYGIFNHVFTNSWLNGSLFAFPFSNNVLFTSNFGNQESGELPPNSPYNCYCKHTIFLDIDTNNHYYRCTPYNTSYGFIGRFNPNISGLNYITNQYYSNTSKTLMFPTTVIDLGPRTDYLEELIFSDEYGGYVSDKLKTTTYQDTSELLGLYLIHRFIATTAFGQVLQAISGLLPIAVTDPVLYYFSRENNKMDADYVQMLQINSQLGVTQFQTSVYNNPNEIYFSNGNSLNSVFGVFFKSNLQTTDYISPKRKILNSFESPSNSCAYDVFGSKSQSVPFYRWNIFPNFEGNSTDSIFGSQKNEWAVNFYVNTPFLTIKYQEVDRMNPLHSNMQPVDQSQSRFFRGYISNIISFNPVTLQVNYSAQPPQAGGIGRTILQGSPYYFYFGAGRGKSSWDLFTEKWIKTDIITFE
jgi:hypothetical protein